MARTVSITANATEGDTLLTKVLQSGHINFLLGSGASLPAISTAGNIEARLDKLLQSSNSKGFAEAKHDFLSAIQLKTNNLISGVSDDANDATLANYKQFLSTISRVLDERKTDLLPKQITIFTTNYDLFIERACEEMLNLRLNDGFTRNPAVRSRYKFQPEHYFDITFKTAALFRYQFPIPTINLVKLHGSLSWQLSGDDLIYSSKARAVPQKGAPNFVHASEAFAKSFSLILPTHEKFHETLLTRVYYDLLRIFANSLEVENTALICFGFSFSDAHIADIVRRALKNPTLLVLILCYDEASVSSYQTTFQSFNNVVILHSEGAEVIDFSRMNALLTAVIPKDVHA
jgi:hypothetical protein